MIVVQQLGISYYVQERRTVLRFAPREIRELNRMAGDTVENDINVQLVSDAIKRLEDTVRELVSQGIRRQPRGSLSIEEPANALRKLVIPQGGLISLIAPEVHPQFSVGRDIAGAIQWEAISEQYAHCDQTPSCKKLLPRVLEPGQSPLFCECCGGERRLAGGPLGLDRLLTYEVCSSRQHPVGQGRDFLLIVDPTSNLLTQANDPDGICREHIQRVKALLQQHGFNVIERRRDSATIRQVISAVQSPTVVGLYYFGHGEAKQAPGTVLLADGPLRGEDLDECGTTPQLVFLNACWAGISPPTLNWEGRSRSVAEAFARGDRRKVVIASPFPLVNFQATLMANAFFESALAGDSLSEALRNARQQSYRRYLQGEADTCWMAYRYLGHPDQKFPKAAQATVLIEQPPLASDPLPLFDEDEELVFSRFSCDLQPMLLEAAFRMNREEREQLTPGDILYGLLHEGALTQYAWSELNLQAASSIATLLHPRKLLELLESETDLWDLVQRHIVCKRSQFSAAMLGWLASAAKQAAIHGGAITEFDMLCALLTADPELVAPPVGPGREALQQWLQQFPRQTLVDNNGIVCLEALSPVARRVVEQSHELSQQRGQDHIPSRLLLSTFLNVSDDAAEMFRERNVAPSELADQLIALTKGESPTNFSLSVPACSRVIIPMLRHLGFGNPATKPDSISELQLFQAFCATAPEEFCEFVAQLCKLFNQNSLPVDLREFAGRTPKSPPGGTRQTSEAAPLRDPLTAEDNNAILPPSPETADFGKPAADRPTGLEFATDAELCLKAGFLLASSQGSPFLRTPHFLAGMLCIETGRLRSWFRRQGICPGEAIALAISKVPPMNPVSSNIVIGPNVAPILQQACELAKREGVRVGERHFYDALLGARPAIVQQLLTELGVDPLAAESSIDGADDTVPQSAQFVRGWDLTSLARRGALPPYAQRPVVDQLLFRLSVNRARLAFRGDAARDAGPVVGAMARALVSDEHPLSGLRIIEVSCHELTGGGRFPAEGRRQTRQMLSSATEEAVLLLTDIEWIVSAADSLAEDFHGCAGRVLVTCRNSRATDRLPGFDSIAVPPLSASDAETWASQQATWIQQSRGLEFSPEAVRQIAETLLAPEQAAGSEQAALEWLQRAAQDACLAGATRIDVSDLRQVTKWR